MKIELIRASLKDAKEIWEMQVKAFKELLDKYQEQIKENLKEYLH